MTFFAVLDACVLHPYSLRDTLLRFAEHEFYAPLWSARILDEMEQSVIATGVSEQRTRRMRRMLESAFDGACVPRASIADLEGAMTNAPADRHVLAAAVTSQAEVIVTANTRDFPETSAEPHGIEVQHPDEFLVNLFDLDPALAAAIIAEQAADQVAPPMLISELLDLLGRAGVPTFARLVRDELGRASAVDVNRS